MTSALSNVAVNALKLHQKCQIGARKKEKVFWSWIGAEQISQFFNVSRIAAEQISRFFKVCRTVAEII